MIKLYTFDSRLCLLIICVWCLHIKHHIGSHIIYLNIHNTWHDHVLIIYLLTLAHFNSGGQEFTIIHDIGFKILEWCWFATVLLICLIYEIENWQLTFKKACTGFVHLLSQRQITKTKTDNFKIYKGHLGFSLWFIIKSIANYCYFKNEFLANSPDFPYSRYSLFP